MEDADATKSLSVKRGTITAERLVSNADQQVDEAEEAEVEEEAWKETFFPGDVVMSHLRRCAAASERTVFRMSSGKASQTALS